MTDPTASSISVILSTCRLAEQTQDLIRALLHQQCQTDFEVLIVDNSCSVQLQGQVRELAASCQVPLRYVPEKVPGLHNVRHRGAAEATGQVLAYLDDDVVLADGWLEGIRRSFEDPDTAMVGGRVVLKFERDPPLWIGAFRSLLSEFDKGTEPRGLSKNETPVGCNMAIRRDVLFRAGGFNPDAFSDRSLIRFRGDGEVGLAEKVRDQGLGLRYQPGALVEHVIPGERMTEHYLRWRSMIGGVEDAYASYRYSPRPVPYLLYRSIRSFFRAAAAARLAGSDPLGGAESTTHFIKSLRHRSCARHHLRQVVSPTLRRWTLQQSYLAGEGDPLRA